MLTGVLITEKYQCALTLDLYNFLISVVIVVFCLFSYFDYKQCAGKYTVMADYEKGGAQELSVKSGDMVQLVKEGDDGQW